MTATFWTGSSLSFTNGSKTVTVNTGPSLDSVKANSSLTAGNYNEPVEVKSVSGNTITLYNNWPGSTGTTSATIKPSAAAAASAGVAAQQLITEIQNLVGSASTTATANSFVKRDSNGRIKAAAPSANDDVVNKSYFQSDVALNDAGIFHEGNSVNPLNYGLKSHASLPPISDLNSIGASLLTSVVDNSTLNRPESAVGHVINLSQNDAANSQFVTDRIYNEVWFRTSSGSVYKPFSKMYHSGNTNLFEFGGISGGDTLGTGVALDGANMKIFLPLSGKTAPTSLTIVGEFIAVQANGAVASANIPASNVALNGASSNKFAVLVVSGLTGLTPGSFYELRSQSTAKITVNF